MKDADGLTPKQRRFVEEYVIDLNASQAAIRAGYAKSRARSTVSRLMATNGNIQAAIEKEQAKKARRNELSSDWVLSRLKIIVDRCMEAEPVLDREGNPTGEYRFDAPGANKALELLGRHISLFPKDTSYKVNITIDDLRKMSREELLALRDKLKSDRI